MKIRPAEDSDLAQIAIIKSVRNGFRSNCIVEFEQIGVRPEYANKGIGRALNSESLELFKHHVGHMSFQLGALVGN